MDLLFVFAYWHAFAKLRLHTEQTLDVLDEWTTILGHECRRFKAETCDIIQTQELQREYESRKRAEARKAASTGKKSGARSKTNAVPMSTEAGGSEMAGRLDIDICISSQSLTDGHTQRIHRHRLRP